MKNTWKRWFALCLSMMLLFTCLPATAEQSAAATADTTAATADVTEAPDATADEPADEPAADATDDAINPEATAVPTPGDVANASEPEALADWTVLLYLCGTDLESANAMATTNLVEIAQTVPNDRVNFVMETGGCKQWHANEQIEGLDIAADRLQRYAYDEDGFTLLEDAPLANMANAATLTEFIQWGVQAYPAQKYMLVMWDHGGGCYHGMISDELYRDSIMSMEDVTRALKDAGTHFEAIVPDACLMATLEVATLLAPYANYLIASEEIVPGAGSAYAAWLQYLYDTPACDGNRFGRVFCDSIQQKYAELGTSESATLTFSVVDLSKIGAVNEAFDAMFTEVSELLSDPDYFNAFGYYTQHAQTYTYPQLLDLADLAVKCRNTALSNETAGAVLEAVENAVTYSIRGSSQVYSHGLTFYYAPQQSVTYLDHYARTCKSAAYLAFLDAVNIKWTAPEWVYEQVERLPEITREDYLVEMEAAIDEEGYPLLTITNAPKAVALIDAELYSYDKTTNEYLSLGADVNVLGDFDAGVFSYDFTGAWPAINGIPCQMTVKDELDASTLYNIPFITESMLDYYFTLGMTLQFRAGLVYDNPIEPYTDAAEGDAPADEAAADDAATDEAATTDDATADDAAATDEAADEIAQADIAEPLTGTFSLYGIWNNINSSTSLPSRDVMELSSINGDNLVLLREATNVYTGETIAYTRSKPVAFDSGSYTFEEAALPKGEYALVFTVKDVFGNSYRSAPISITWTGKAVIYSMME